MRRAPMMGVLYGSLVGLAQDSLSHNPLDLGLVGLSQFLPFLDSVQAKVKAMPSTTLEDNIARMTTQVREVAKFQKQ